ncbi:hypothetical protein NQ318_022406 [Aromia moschata]|uniref:Uncharacterized protein n=1 Tax=Aromia moschata TaxID=1265417 RepID=A0AAV8Z570_9CUCU|nr:hypothetical protein NQ318_022406 [Aromia moschata]
MLKKPLIPLSLVRDLRCRQCEKFVSCGPVYVVPDTSILCGRCRHLAKNIYRNTSYEALASMFMYPCCNWEEHCSTHLHWNESLQHEEDCNYQGFCKFLCHHPRAYCKGKREIPEGDVRLTPVPEQLLDYIKCVQCECYLTCEPVYVQTNGKNVCHRCVHANGVPPNCLRNTAYEMLSTIIIFPCIYRNRGCPTRLKFGRSLWQHEAECSYGQTFKKITNQKAENQKVAKQANQKERGVIQTHSGHYYGTLTPNVVLFAPPTEKTEFDMNRELLKSLKKQQERRFVRADEIGTQLEKFNSEDGSINTDDSEKKNSYSKSWESDRSSPRLDENDQRQKAMNHNQPLIVEPGYFSNNPKSPHINGENYYQNTFIAQVHREDYPSPRISRQNSYNKAYYANMVYANGFGDQNSGTNSPQPFSNKKPNVENNILAGHYPVIRTSSGIRDQNEGSQFSET